MTITVRVAASPEDWTSIAELFEEYVASLHFELTFQDVAREFGELETEYGPPAGAALLALAGTKPVGAVGVREFGPGVGELKRMYVRPSARGLGAGRALAAAAVAAARTLGYRTLRLDTVAEMTAAIRIYTDLGFREIPPYRHNPLPTARYFEVELQAGPAGPA